MRGKGEGVNVTIITITNTIIITITIIIVIIIIMIFDTRYTDGSTIVQKSHHSSLYKHKIEQRELPWRKVQLGNRFA